MQIKLEYSLYIYIYTVFDAGEENKFSYTDIHKEYNALVSQ